MGSCCFNRCFNTPHAFQLGWISAQQLAALAPGQSVSLQLPSQSVSAAGSALRVVPTWAPGVPDLWLGYRTKAGGDAELFDAFAGKLSAYTLQPATDFSHPQASLLLATLPGAAGCSTVFSCRLGGALVLFVQHAAMRHIAAPHPTGTACALEAQPSAPCPGPPTPSSQLGKAGHGSLPASPSACTAPQASTLWSRCAGQPLGRRVPAQWRLLPASE